MAVQQTHSVPSCNIVKKKKKGQSRSVPLPKPPRIAPERLGVQSRDLLHIPRQLSLQQLQALVDLVLDWNTSHSEPSAAAVNFISLFFQPRHTE
jgi:hypothetical protein